MSAIIIDGKAIASNLNEESRKEAEILKGKGINPTLAVVILGDNPASLSYVRGKKKALANAGMEGRDIKLPENTSEDELLSMIDSLNRDNLIHGILIQLPLPSHIREEKIIIAIDPIKDVDCFHPLSIGRMFLGQKCFLPCTPHGIIKLLHAYDIPVAGSNVVIVGRSNIVGKPLALLFARRENNATVTICHTGTKDLAGHTRSADILIAAAGIPALIGGDMIKKGAAVIDVAINRIPDSSKKKGYRIIGDVKYEEAAEIAGWITPVPGGVGPMTITMLLANTLRAAKKRSGA